MSTIRRETSKRRRGKDGAIVCSCGCGRTPPKGRATWFSQECVDSWKIANDPGYVRIKLLERDNGVCAECGIDAKEVEKKLKLANDWINYRRHPPSASQMRHIGFDENGRNIWKFRFREGTSSMGVFLRDKYDHVIRIHRRWTRKAQEAAKNRLAKMKAMGWTTHRKTAWDADHIIPVVEGGGQCGLENYRTLCHICHKKATKALAARRAAK